MDRLGAMRSFVEVVDRGGFSPAARTLGLSGPMVGNHVRFLEARLGGRLLNRTSRAQHLTEFGEAYLRRCRTVLAELDAPDAEAAALTGTARGSLRVTAPHSLGSVVLAPIIARFLREHPAVSIELHLDDRRLDLLADRFDLALRGGELEDGGLISCALPPLELVVCAAPDYLARRGEPATPADLASHDCLDCIGSSTPGVWRFDAGEGAVDVAVSGLLCANSGATLSQAALAGTGVILQPHVLVREPIADGRLVQLLKQHPAQSRPLQLLTHPDRQPTPKLTSFVAAIVRDLAGVDGFRSQR